MKKIIIVITLCISFIITIPFLTHKNNNLIDNLKSIKHFKKEYSNRYIKYKKKYPNTSNINIVTYVNIGLDNSFYTNTSLAKNIGKPYVLVNKYNYLNSTYVPENLIKVDNTKLVDYVAIKFNEMKTEAKKNNLNIVAISGYRSFNYQNNLYNKYVTVDGKTKADTYSARPGYSEHQTGLAVDISNGNNPYYSFENTKEFNWIQDNAYKYGFILRYPKDKENITGYSYESWHYRYVGLEISSYIKKNNITYDEYYVMFIDG